MTTRTITIGPEPVSVRIIFVESLPNDRMRVLVDIVDRYDKVCEQKEMTIDVGDTFDVVKETTEVFDSRNHTPQFETIG